MPAKRNKKKGQINYRSRVCAHNKHKNTCERRLSVKDERSGKK